MPGRTKIEEGLSRGMSLEQMMADGAQIVKVKVPQGWALCFFHGAHALSMMHAGGKVQSGVKRIIRSDVLYYLPDKGPAAMAEERAAAAAREEAAARAAAQTADWEEKADGFTASETFTGPVAGAVFRRGRHGQGYYRDALAAREASGLAAGLDKLSVQG